MPSIKSVESDSKPRLRRLSSRSSRPAVGAGAATDSKKNAIFVINKILVRTRGAPLAAARNASSFFLSSLCVSRRKSISERASVALELSQHAHLLIFSICLSLVASRWDCQSLYLFTDWIYEFSDMDQIGEPTQAQRLEGFSFLFYLTETIGLILIVLVTIWTVHFRGGFAWSSDPDHQFNWHPLLMTIGLVFLYANGMLIYRSQRQIRKRRLKLMHAGIMIFTLLLTLIAQIAVFSMHNAKGIPNLYSLHSWVGLASILLFCCQWVAGFVSFLYPMIQAPLRAAILPIHVYFGTAGFITTIAACLIGLTEKALFTMNKPENMYANLPAEGAFINIIGLVFVVFAGLTVYLVSQERYKRLAQPEDDVLLNTRN